MSNTFQLQKKKSSGNGEIMCLLRLLFKRNCTAPSWFFFNHSCSFLVFCTRAKLIFLKRKSEYHSLLKIFPKLFFGIKTKSHNHLQDPASLTPHNGPVAFSTSGISHSPSSFWSILLLHVLSSMLITCTYSLDANSVILCLRHQSCSRLLQLCQISHHKFHGTLLLLYKIYHNCNCV